MHRCFHVLCSIICWMTVGKRKPQEAEIDASKNLSCAQKGGILLLRKSSFTVLEERSRVQWCSWSSIIKIVPQSYWSFSSKLSWTAHKGWWQNPSPKCKLKINCTKGPPVARGYNTSSRRPAWPLGSSENVPPHFQLFRYYQTKVQSGMH